MGTPSDRLLFVQRALQDHLALMLVLGGDGALVMVSNLLLFALHLPRLDVRSILGMLIQWAGWLSIPVGSFPWISHLVFVPWCSGDVSKNFMEGLYEDCEV